MSNPVVPTNPPESTPPTSPPVATAPVGGAAPATPPAPAWTAPANAPEWAKRLNPDELLALAQKGAETLQNPRPPAPATVTGPAVPTIADWIERPNEAAQAVSAQHMASVMAPLQATLQGMQTAAAQTQRALAARDFSEDFAKWGPEIDGHMARVPAEQRTLDNYEKVVKFVRGNHLDELVEAKAKALLAGGGLTERAGGSNGGINPTNPNGYSPDKLGRFGELAKLHGLTEAQVTEFCRRNNTTVEAWMKGAQDSQMFTSASPFQVTMTDEKLGIKGVFGE